MRFKARSGAGGRQGYGQGNRTVRNAKETLRERVRMARAWCLATGVDPKLAEHLAALAGVCAVHQRVTSAGGQV